MPKKKTTPSTNNDVGEALALLSDTLTDEQTRIGEEGAIAMKAGDLQTARDVIDRVGEKMKSTLKPIDYESHKSNEKQLRWRNTAQWARNKMVNSDARMKKDSPNGIWEISDKGRKWLERQNSP